MKKFSIIGANSSLARNFVYYLKDKDVQLDLYDIQPTGLEGNDNYKQVDLLNASEVNKINFDCDAVYLFTGLTGPEKSFAQYEFFIDVNEKVLLNVLNAYKEHNSKARFVYPSSRLVYKNSIAPLKESDELEGLSIYAVNKIASENYIKTYSLVYGVKYTILRIAIPFGKLNPSCTDYGIVSKFRRQAEDNGVITLYGDGSGKRTFTHIKNVCEVFYKTVLTESTQNEIYNVGGKAYSLYELASLQANKSNARIEYLPWPALSQKVDVANGVFDYSKLDKVLKIDYIDVAKDIY